MARMDTKVEMMRKKPFGCILRSVNAAGRWCASSSIYELGWTRGRRLNCLPGEEMEGGRKAGISRGVAEQVARLVDCRSHS